MSKAHPFRLSLYSVIDHYKNERMWQYHSFFLFSRIDNWASIIFNEAENYISARNDLINGSLNQITQHQAQQ